jgi:hypothetical protein
MNKPDRLIIINALQTHIRELRRTGINHPYREAQITYHKAATAAEKLLKRILEEHEQETTDPRG